MKVNTISYSTFKDHARDYLQPTVWHAWQDHQADLIRHLAGMEGGLMLGGDGRSDSPGHSAKFGSYTAMEMRINKVLEISLVQVL